MGIELLPIDKDFDMSFQPIVRASDCALVGFEALARPKNGMSPVAFFEGLCRTDAIIADYRCRQLALKISHLLRLDGQLFLNIIPSAVCHPIYGMHSTIRLALELGVSLRRLVFEITEHNEIDDYYALISSIAPSRSDGVQIALDDFGTGFNNLVTLLELRPDIVKLDRRFLHIIQKDKERNDLTHQFINGCQAFGCQILAEGVETNEAFNTMKNLGVDLMQGYYFGAPTPNPQEYF